MIEGFFVPPVETVRQNPLTDTQQTVIFLSAQGYTAGEIAKKLPERSTRFKVGDTLEEAGEVYGSASPLATVVSAVDNNDVNLEEVTKGWDFNRYRRLSPEHQDILCLSRQGMGKTQIINKLDIANESTWRFPSLYRLLGARNLIQATVFHIAVERRAHVTA
jgi:DNA-binding NarL/FixJ family response regulator